MHVKAEGVELSFLGTSLADLLELRFLFTHLDRLPESRVSSISCRCARVNNAFPHVGMFSSAPKEIVF